MGQLLEEFIEKISKESLNFGQIEGESRSLNFSLIESDLKSYKFMPRRGQYARMGRVTY